MPDRRTDGRTLILTAFNVYNKLGPKILFLEGYKGTKYYDGQVPVIPRSWAHICLGLDTVSGLLRIGVNGKVIENEEREFFRGTDTIKPKSVAGKFVGRVSVSEHFQGLRTLLKLWNF